MDLSICVYGLWHLGCVTAACLADAGARVLGLDPDAERVADLKSGRLPIAEPGLEELVRAGLASGRLSFTAEPKEALADADVVWVAFDTPVDAADHADVDWVLQHLECVRPLVRSGALILVSSQLPVGSTRRLEREWLSHDDSLTFAYSPENLRLGQALAAFRRPERVVIGLGHAADRAVLKQVFAPFCDRIEWMSLESAEMTKHALNSFLAVSVVYANELARLCERVGADAREVERGLRTDVRIGSRAYLAPGPPLAGGTLARDIEFLRMLSAEHGLESPLFDAVPKSNRVHQAWTRNRISELAQGLAAPRVAVLGLTYKPGTSTLRRSASVELARWLLGSGVQVQTFDPAIASLPDELDGVHLASSVEAALAGADVAVIATPWPEFAGLTADAFVGGMRKPCVIDQAGFMAHLADDARVTYLRVGRPVPAQ